MQNQGRVNEALQSFYGAFAGGNRASVFDSSNLGSIPVKGQAGSEDSIYSDVNKYIEKNNLKGKVNVQEKDNGISLELQENILFDPGSALIKPENTGVLDKIGELLKTLSNDIIIEGYTDDRPIDSGYYQSNWELSSDRAVKILRYFTDTAGLKPERFQAVGYCPWGRLAKENPPCASVTALYLILSLLKTMRHPGINRLDGIALNIACYFCFFLFMIKS